MHKRFPFLNGAVEFSSREPWDEVLHETSHFVVVPSQGSFVVGWLLIVPKKPYICLGSMPDCDFEEFVQLKDNMKDLVRRAFGQVVCWENGPSTAGESHGCGVDHAHFHVVPSEVDLVRGSQRIAGQAVHFDETPEGIGSIRPLAKAGNPYLYVEDERGCFLSKSKRVPSQMFRQVLAASHGIPDQFDWRSFPFRENAKRTLDLFSHCVTTGGATITPITHPQSDERTAGGLLN